jgi:type I restriction-modification system DNA methylase subunit
MSSDLTSLASARTQIEQLVARCHDNISSYKNPSYKEAQARVDFINPLFDALGWDVYNKAGYAEAYRDVIHEDAIKVGGLTKAPDYCFRIGGQRKFFVEAKKPFVSIKSDPEPYYQLRRYAYSAKLPLSILTDFEELAIVDCRDKPSKHDKPSTGRIRYWRYEEYADNLEEIYNTFSKEAVLRGSFDRFAVSKKARRGTGEVDKEFLREIESWRDLLARNIALRNPSLSQRDLNAAVQLTIDRVIFLRICEDRGIEEYGVLQGLQNGVHVYARLTELFQRADERYNSGLFHFGQERDRSGQPDELTLSLAIDDKPLKDILKALYYPDSPFEFSVLPIDILGQVYEQFLGKVIRLTAGHRAVVEEKPEVKKAGGVYYTPSYIVDYIVKNTVGRFIDGKSTKQIANLRILDPACGSGSFLIGAYEYLLEWHRDWYISDGAEKWVAKKDPRLFQGRNGWQLTTAEKKRILLNNIHGVDIDPQAVEVTKLSLLLKVLEEENAETIGKNLSLFHERALPDLSNNIKCGNSLIGDEFYDGQQMGLLGQAELYRVNPFNWQKQFPEIMKDDGFDVIIGNPPYVRIQALKEWVPAEVEFYKQEYRSAEKGNYDLYLLFVEQGLNLLSKSGKLGFILPSKFLTTDYGAGLRAHLAEKEVLDRVVDFGHNQVFQNATTYTCLLFLNQMKHKQVRYMSIKPEDLISSKKEDEVSDIKAFDGGIWTFVSKHTEDLLGKLKAESTLLLDIPVQMSRGSSSGADTVFCLSEVDGELITRSGEPVEVEAGILRKPLYATDFTRYWFRPKNNERIIFPYIVNEDRYSLIDEVMLEEQFPKAYGYLSSQRKALEDRKQYKSWYGFSAPRNLHVHEHANLMVPLLADRGLCAPIEQNEKYCVMASAGFSLRVASTVSIDSNYLLGLINSKLLFGNMRLISNKFRGGWITCTKQYFGQLPIRNIDFADVNERSMHDQMIELVERMLTLNKQLIIGNSSHEKTMLQRQIEATDNQIDKLVYDLYGLTEEEIKIVQG